MAYLFLCFPRMVKAMAYLAISLLFISPATTKAQDEEPAYKEYEQLVKVINDIQRSANDKKATLEHLDVRTIYFPEMNFMFSYHNLSCTWIQGGAGLREVYPNINLADVGSIMLHEKPFGEVGMVTIELKQNQKYTIVREDRSSTKDVRKIYFFFPYAQPSKGDDLLKALSGLIYRVKVKRGVLPSVEATLEQVKWKLASWENKIESYVKILPEMQSSIFLQLIHNRIENLDKRGDFSNIYSKIPEKPELVFVKGGTFSMGNSEGRNFYAKDRLRQVSVSDFYIGVFPVTVGQYQKFCAATGTQMPEAPSWGWNSSQPMVNVTYHDAVRYTAWLNVKYGGNWRLPTDAEWVYAARGGNKTKGYSYSGGDFSSEVAWYSSDRAGRNYKVGTKKANELGIYDMTGNVWEWCYDWFGSFSKESLADPKGPPKGSSRIIRGGYMYDGLANVEARLASKPNTRNYDYGFRVVFVQ